MAVMDGCESQRRTAVLEDRICPKCGKEVEVFTNGGRIPNLQNVLRICVPGGRDSSSEDRAEGEMIPDAGRRQRGNLSEGSRPCKIKDMNKMPPAYKYNNTWDCVNICKGAFFMENFQVYRDIQARTGGDIYIGVVGPVRTGKSTFVRHFMELGRPSVDGRQGSGRSKRRSAFKRSGEDHYDCRAQIYSREAVPVKLGEDQTVRVKIIDCVGFLVKDAAGHVEEGRERW